MDISLLQDIVTIFIMSVAVLWICNKLRIPTIVGFIFTGIISGPHGLGIVKSASDVDTLAEIGIVLLLFTIGLEFSLKRLKEIKFYFFVGGILQVSLTVLVSFGFAELLGRPLGEALFLGFLVSMSSTAIVLKALEKQDAVESPQGRVSVGILIFQDIIAVPMMIVTPLLSESQNSFDIALLLHLLIGLVIILLVFFIAIKVVPILLYHIAKVRSRELFSLSILTICFAVAWISGSIGLSLAIGAFLAGLIISESEYRHEAIGNILPLQDIFSSLFFVSIGMVLNLEFVKEQPLLIIALAFGIILMKSIVAAFTTFCLGQPLRIMIISGLALSQIGEFSFVLAKTGINSGIATDYYYQLFLAVALLTMSITPSLIDFSAQIAQFFEKLPFPKKIKSGLRPSKDHLDPILQGHVVIIGFGVAGHHMAMASKNSNLPYIVLEMNAKTVKKEQLKGEPIHFGDATHDAVLRYLNIQTAKTVAIMINDPLAIRRIVPLARKMNPAVYIIVRTRYIQDMQALYQLGADDVIPDEFGSSLEMFTRVLQKYEVAQSQIEDFVTNLREVNFKTLHKVPIE